MNNSKIEEVVKMAKEMLGGDVDVEVLKVTPKKEEEKGTLIPDSLISEEEKKAVKDLVEAFDKFMELHKSSDRVERILKAQKDDYTMLQYLMYADHIRDAVYAIGSLNYVCHEMTREHVDEVAKDNDMTLKEMVTSGMINAIKNMTSMLD